MLLFNLPLSQTKSFTLRILCRQLPYQTSRATHRAVENLSFQNFTVRVELLKIVHQIPFSYLFSFWHKNELLKKVHSVPVTCLNAHMTYGLVFFFTNLQIFTIFFFY